MFSLILPFIYNTIELYIIQVFSLLSIFVPSECQETSSICYLTNLSPFNEFVTVYNFITLIYLLGLYTCKKYYEPYVKDFHESHRIINFYNNYIKFINGAIVISLSNILFSSVLLFGQSYYKGFSTVTTLITSSTVVLQQLFIILKEANTKIENRKEDIIKNIIEPIIITNNVKKSEKSPLSLLTCTKIFSDNLDKPLSIPIDKNISITIDESLNKIHLIKTLDKELESSVVIGINDRNNNEDEIVDVEEDSNDFVNIDEHEEEITPPSIVKKNNNNLIKHYFNYNI